MAAIETCARAGAIETASRSSPGWWSHSTPGGARLPRGDLWFIALEEGWVSAVEVIDGVWRRIHAARMSSDSNVEFERMQALARLARGPGARIFIEAPPALRARARAHWQRSRMARG